MTFEEWDAVYKWSHDPGDYAKDAFDAGRQSREPIKTLWLGSEQRSDNDWYAVKVFFSERRAKLWMYEKSNRTAEKIEVDDAD